MKITRDVVLDLLPLYLSGEASADTGALIVEYLAQDPELAQRIRAQPTQLLKDAVPIALPPGLEVRALRRARTLLNLQKWLFGPAIAFTAVACAFEVKFDNGRLQDLHLVIQDHPLPMGVAALLAAACWCGYFWARRVLR